MKVSHVQLTHGHWWDERAHSVARCYDIHSFENRILHLNVSLIMDSHHKTKCCLFLPSPRTSIALNLFGVIFKSPGVRLIWWAVVISFYLTRLPLSCISFSRSCTPSAGYSLSLRVWVTDFWLAQVRCFWRRCGDCFHIMVCTFPPTSLLLTLCFPASQSLDIFPPLAIFGHEINQTFKWSST